MLLNRLRLLLLAAILIGFPTIGISADGTQSPRRQAIIIAADHWPPYSFSTSRNSKPGMDVEVVEAALSRVGITALIEFYSWPRSLKMIQEGTIAGLLSIADTPERHRDFLLSAPINRSRSCYIVRKDFNGPQLAQLDDTRNLNVGAVQEGAISELLTSLHIYHDLSTSQEIAIRKLADNRLDVVVLEQRNAEYHVKKLGYETKLQCLPGAEKSDMYLGFSRKWPNAKQLVKSFDKGLTLIIQDGTYDAIHAKYE